MASKYNSLARYFSQLEAATREVTLTFRGIESILGFDLPKSATDYRQWWGNQADSNYLPQAAAWMNAGFVVDTVQPKSLGVG